MAQPLIQAIKGMPDLLGESMETHRSIVQVAGELARQFGFLEISTPMLEPTALFQRSLGTESDVVKKQMYTFADLSGESVTLRPEGTAPVVRALIERNRFAEPNELKLFYSGPMVRYERPQKGRQRQFHQFGVEYFGSDDPHADVEALLLATEIFSKFSIEPTLKIHSIGKVEERREYLSALTAHLSRSIASLCSDCQRRLTTNPLRVLDCKQEQCQPTLESAPRLLSAMSERSRTRFERVTQLLTEFGIPFEVDHRLVRGIDYYNDTVFEFHSAALGAQSAVLAGGRYDALVSEFGGPSTPAVGWAFGIERFALITGSRPLPPLALVLLPIGTGAFTESLRLQRELTRSGLSVDLILQDRRLKALFKEAERRGAPLVAILGETELKEGTIILKRLSSSQQMTVPRADINTLISSIKRFSAEGASNLV